MEEGYRKNIEDIEYSTRTGPGLYEFLEDENTLPYDPTKIRLNIEDIEYASSIDVFKNFLKELWHDKI